MSGGRYLLALALLLPLPGAAQTGCPLAPPPDSAAPPPDRPPDLLLRATVSARSLRFSSAPRVRVRTLGCAPWDSVVVTERVNLPDPVQPGVTYRDVRVGIEIRSWLDLRCALPVPAASVTPADSVPARPLDPCAWLLARDSLPASPRGR